MLRGDGRHATSNGCGGRSNCVLAHGNFNRVSPFDDEPFANSQAATTFVAASITRALSYASLETTIVRLMNSSMPQKSI